MAQSAGVRIAGAWRKKQSEAGTFGGMRTRRPRNRGAAQGLHAKRRSQGGDVRTDEAAPQLQQRGQQSAVCQCSVGLLHARQDARPLRHLQLLRLGRTGRWLSAQRAAALVR